MVAVGQLKQIGDNLWQDDAGNLYLDAEGTMPVEDQLPFSRPAAAHPMYREMTTPKELGNVWSQYLRTNPLYQSAGAYGKQSMYQPGQEFIDRWRLAELMPATGDFEGWAGGLGVPILGPGETTGTFRQFIESGVSQWTRDEWINGMRAMRNIGLIPSAIDPNQFNAMSQLDISSQITDHDASQSDNPRLRATFEGLDWDEVNAIALGVMGISALPPRMKKLYITQYDNEKAKIERDFPDLVTTPQNWLTYLAFSGWNLNGLGLPVEGQEFRDATKPIPPAPTNIPPANEAKARVYLENLNNQNAPPIATSNENENQSTVENNAAASANHLQTHQAGRNFSLPLGEAETIEIDTSGEGVRGDGSGIYPTQVAPAEVARAEEIPWQQTETGTAFGHPIIDISPTGVPMGTVSGTTDFSDEGFPLIPTMEGADTSGIGKRGEDYDRFTSTPKITPAVSTEGDAITSVANIFQEDSTPESLLAIERSQQGIQPHPFPARAKDWDLQEFNIPTDDYPAPTNIWDLRAQPGYHRKEPIGGWTGDYWKEEDSPYRLSDIYDPRLQQLGLPPGRGSGDLFWRGVSSLADAVSSGEGYRAAYPMDLGDINYPNISPMDMPFINPVASGIQTVDYTQPISPTNIGYGGVGVGTGVEPSPWGGYNLGESYGYGWINPYTGKQFVPAQQY